MRVSAVRPSRFVLLVCAAFLVPYLCPADPPPPPPLTSCAAPERGAETLASAEQRQRSGPAAAPQPRTAPRRPARLRGHRRARWERGSPGNKWPSGRDRGLRSAPPCVEDGRSGKAYRAASLSIHTYKNIHASVYGCIIYNSLSAAGIPSSDELLKNNNNN